MFKKKADKEINIGSQPEQEEESVLKKKIKREESEPALEPEPEVVIIPRAVSLPIQPLPIVVPEPKVVTDIYTKYGGWIFKNGKVFIKEISWSLTEEAKSGIVPERMKPYFDVRSMASFSRQIKKQR